MKILLTVDDLRPDERASVIERAVFLRSQLDEGHAIESAAGGFTVGNVFFEASTRTQLSFDLAAQHLGARVLNLNLPSSSTSKGESLRDTVETVSAIGVDVLVARHTDHGSLQAIHEWTKRPVINAGEGAHAHPTQALLDAVTLVRHFGAVEGLSIGIIGDVAHSRVAASLCRLLPKLGAQVFQIGPPDFLSDEIDVEQVSDLGSVLGSLDVAYLLRVQRERGAEITDSYIDAYQMNGERFRSLGGNAVVMHPGPVNRGVEVTTEVLDEARCLVLEQVANGVPTRMAVMEWVLSA